ncbi:MAG: hypothetical protein Q9190_003492 [Brigantiaea leucoxantha]
MGVIYHRAVFKGRGTELALVSIVTTVLALCVVTIRITARAFLTNALGHDDAAIVFSMIFSIALCIVNCISVYYGVGKPISTLLPYEIHRALLVRSLSPFPPFLTQS